MKGLEQLNVFTFFKYTWPIWAWWGWIVKGFLKSEAQEAERLEKDRRRMEKEHNLHEFLRHRKEVTQVGNERPQDRKISEEDEGCAQSEQPFDSRQVSAEQGRNEVNGDNESLR